MTNFSPAAALIGVTIVLYIYFIFPVSAISYIIHDKVGSYPKAFLIVFMGLFILLGALLPSFKIFIIGGIRSLFSYGKYLALFFLMPVFIATGLFYKITDTSYDDGLKYGVIGYNVSFFLMFFFGVFLSFLFAGTQIPFPSPLFLFLVKTPSLFGIPHLSGLVLLSIIISFPSWVIGFLIFNRGEEEEHSLIENIWD